MKIKQRVLLNKIESLHNKLLNTTILSDKEESEFQKRYADYHNWINIKILQLEKKKSSEQK